MKCLPIIVLALSLLTAVTACNDASCYDNGSSLPLATFYMSDTALDTAFTASIPSLSIKGIGVPGDSLLASSSTLSQSYLPLRANAHSTSFALWRVVTIDSVNVTVTDTITLQYEPIPYFASEECGAMYNFDVQNVSHTRHGLLDSVKMLSSLVTNSRTPVMNIYFTPY